MGGAFCRLDSIGSHGPGGGIPLGGGGGGGGWGKVEEFSGTNVIMAV